MKIALLGWTTAVGDTRPVLFTLIAERYERRSLGITSNLVFSEWEKVFANPMATAAAIDRIVHHSVILEFDLPSYRTSEAQGRQLQERQLHRTPTGALPQGFCYRAEAIASRKMLPKSGRCLTMMLPK